MTWSFQSVDSSRQTWEDRVNVSFGRVKSAERVCFHANCTVFARPLDVLRTECDYCPAWTETTDYRPALPVPVYFKDPEPLFLPVKR